jgi:VWFA-related protein
MLAKRRARPREVVRASLVVAVILPLVLLSGGAVWSQQEQQQPQSSQEQKQAQPAVPPAAPSSTAAGPPQAQSKIASQVKLVTLYATVRDKHGKIISNLNQADFALEEDTRPQAISYFARESDLPLTLGLLIDTSRSQRRVLDQERSASYAFLDKLLRISDDPNGGPKSDPKSDSAKASEKDDKDKAFVIHFDHEVELLQDLTTSREKLRSALEHLDEPEFANTSGSSGGGSGGGNGGGGGSGRGGRGGGTHGGGTLLYDSIYLASNELMQKQKGRKALIVLTDGVDNGSKESLLSAIESAQRADTAVYSILFADEEGYGHGSGYGGGHGGYGGGGGGMGRGGGGGRRYPSENRPDGKKVLTRISKETGGELYQVSKKETIDQIYAQIEEGLRNQYSLGYAPDRASAESTYHLIHLTANQKELVVQARDGYYSAP